MPLRQTSDVRPQTGFPRYLLQCSAALKGIGLQPLANASLLGWAPASAGATI